MQNTTQMRWTVLEADRVRRGHRDVSGIRNGMNTTADMMKPIGICQNTIET